MFNRGMGMGEVKKKQALQIHAEVAEMLLHDMDNNDAGLMIKAMCMYHFHNDPEWLKEKSLRLTFKLLRGRMDRDAAAYADKCAKNRENRLQYLANGGQRPLTNVDERLPDVTKTTNPDPKPDPEDSKESGESTRAHGTKYPEWLTGELLTEFEAFLGVYEATWGKKPHPGQMDEILLDLAQITASERLQSVRGSKKYGQKTIHDHRSFKKPNGQQLPADGIPAHKRSTSLE